MQLEDLKRTIKGSVIAAGEAGWAYATDGLAWNGRKPDAAPVLIVRAADAHDVQVAVGFAAAQGLKVSARSSGHNLSGISVQNGVVIDLGAMNGIRIDAEARLAEVGPGAKNLAIAEALTAAGLAFPLGHCGGVSVGGYLLGGGLGWNGGKWGIACHSIESADVVMADGSLVRASKTENTQLFWALRGAGPAFFGIVTSYRLRLQPLPKAITVAAWVYPLARVAEVTSWMQACAATMPNNVELSMSMASSSEQLLAAAEKSVTAVMTVFADTNEEAAVITSGLGRSAPTKALAIQPPEQSSFTRLYEEIDSHYQRGMRYSVDSIWSSDPTITFPGLARMIEEAPGAGSNALAFLYPEQSDVLKPLPDGAFSMVSAAYGLVYGIWADPAEDALHLAWMRAGVDAVAEATLGHCIGEADLARPGRIARCYGEQERTQIEALRATYDAKGAFSGRVVRDGGAEIPMALTFG